MIRLAIKQRGTATVEMAIVVVIFLILMLTVVELGRAVQANNIITHISREGANLYARNRVNTPQEIMDALSLSSNPLDINEAGQIFLTVVVGQEDAAPFVLEQHRWLSGQNRYSSTVWAGCGSWDAAGECEISSESPPTTGNVPMSLDDGEATHILEVYYLHDTFTEFFLGSGWEIYSRSLM